MKTFVFSLSPQRVALSTAATLGLATLACPLQALAQNASINAIQLSVDVAPITISGERLGGSVSASGNGLSNAPTLPTLAIDGATNAMTTAFQTAVGATFNFDVSARAADGSIGLSTANNAAPLSADFGSQSGRFSAGGTGTLSIAADNDASVTAGAGSGVTATAIFSTTMNTGVNEAQIRRVATSGNNQATFTAERQGARYQHGGSGLAAVTAGGTLGAATVGAAPAITTVSTGGATPETAGVAFTRTEAVRTGQASTALTATANTPPYGITTNTIGGATAGTITSTNMNTLTVNAGGAGTSSTLSVIQSLTAF